LVNTDLDPGFEDQKQKIFTVEKKFEFFKSKIAIYLFLNLYEGSFFQAMGKGSSSPKRTKRT
jgi:hypothetical protein